MAENKNILIVEDDRETAHMIEVILGLEGYSTSSVHHGVDIREQVKRVKPDLIVLDIMLPIVSGMEVLHQLKDDEEMKDIPVVICSVRYSEKDKQLAMEGGADGYVVKPFDPESLVKAIEKALQDKATS
jgi:DNA-binding response OmpR family regulator